MKTGNRNLKRQLLIYLALLLVTCSCTLNAPEEEIFYNPLLESGPDPYAFFHTDGYYYYTHTLGDRLDLWRTRDITDLKHAERKTIFVPPPDTTFSNNLWAPEVIFMNGRWYFYFAADDGNHVNHRIYVLENSSKDPFEGEFVMKGKVSPADDNWAIDGDVFEHNGELYMIWSGWVTTPWEEYEIQRIYIARMSDPKTISSARIELSHPEHEWEMQYKNPEEWGNDPGRKILVNEGPQILKHGKKLFIIYSASGCWTPHYKLGMLEASAGSDLLDPGSWKKHEQPVFTMSEENKVYGTGHNSFFKSPDGKEDWILYHANDSPDQGCGRFRKPRAQRIEWSEDGYPVFGEALSTSTPIEKPSGTKLLIQPLASQAVEQAVKAAPNILIIMADDATYNDLPLYGGVNVKTPHIDRLAEEGLVFNRAFLSMSMCVPCRAALYSGMYPVRNGVCWNHVPARSGLTSIVQHLEKLGYRTGLAGKVHASPVSVFPFEMVEGIERNCVSETAKYDDRELASFINRDQTPFCLVAALVVPHIPWTVGDPSHFDPDRLALPPYLADTPETRKEFASYLAEIEVLDHQVGSLLDMLEETGKAGNTIVIFTSEQGAQLPSCKWTNWNTGVHTAFVIRWPGKVTAGRRTDALIQYVDVLPTLIEAAGGDPGEGDFDGSSFLQVLLGVTNEHREYAYFMHNNIPEGPPYPIRSVTDGRYHYIRNLQPENLYIEKHVMARMPLNPYWDSWMWAAWEDDHALAMLQRYMIRPPEQLYRLDTDPNEMNDLTEEQEHLDAIQRLSNELDRWMRIQGDPGASIDRRTVWEEARDGNHFAPLGPDHK